MKLWRIVADFVFNRTSGDRGKTPARRCSMIWRQGTEWRKSATVYDGGRYNDARVDIILPGFCPYYNFRG